MNIQSYTVNEQINALAGNIRGIVKMAYENYEIGSKPFVQLIDAAEETKKKIENLKAKGDSEFDERLNRLDDFQTNERMKEY